MKRLLFSTTLLALTACNTDLPTLAETVAPTGQTYETKTRTLHFHGGPSYEKVPAKCHITGPNFSKSFTTPATFKVPMAKRGRVAITNLTCTINGVTKTVDRIPGEYTRVIRYAPDLRLFDFWFFGKSAYVLYGARNNKIATVSGAPPP